jgi:hypothetical protein
MGDTAFLGRPWLAGPPGAGLRLIRDYAMLLARADEVIEQPGSTHSAAGELMRDRSRCRFAWCSCQILPTEEAKDRFRMSHRYLPASQG